MRLLFTCWLYKEGGPFIRRSFQKRYFEVFQDRFQYRKEIGGKILNQIFIKDIVSLQKKLNVKAPKGIQEFSFEIVLDGMDKVYSLCAENEDDLQRWLGLVESFRESAMSDQDVLDGGQLFGSSSEDEDGEFDDQKEIDDGLEDGLEDTPSEDVQSEDVPSEDVPLDVPSEGDDFQSEDAPSEEENSNVDLIEEERQGNPSEKDVAEIIRPSQRAESLQHSPRTDSMRNRRVMTLGHFPQAKRKDSIQVSTVRTTKVDSFGSSSSSEIGNENNIDFSFMDQKLDDEVLNENIDNPISDDGSSDDEFEDFHVDDEAQFLESLQNQNDEEESLVTVDSFSMGHKILFPPEDIDLVMNAKSNIIDDTLRKKGTISLKERHDFVDLAKNPSYEEIAMERNSPEVFFSGKIHFIMRKKKRLEMIISLSQEALLLLSVPKSNDSVICEQWLSYEKISHCIFTNEVKQDLVVGIIVPKLDKDIILEFSDMQNRELFIAHLKDLYFAMHGNDLEVVEVEDVPIFCRKSPGDKFIAPVSIHEDEKLVSSDHDYVKIGNSFQWRIRLRKYGEKKILFSEIVEKVKTTKVKHIKIRAKRVFIITDKAVYNCKLDTTVKRRIALEDIKKLYIEEKNSKSLLFVVPFETKQQVPSYDLYIKFRASVDCQKKRKTVRKLLQLLIPKIKVGQGRNVKYTFGNLAKTQAYRVMLRKRKDPNEVRKQLRKAIKAKDVTLLENAIEIATQIDMESDPLLPLAKSQLHKLHSSTEIVYLWKLAQSKSDFKAMKILLQQAEDLRPLMSDFVRKVKPTYNFMMNEMIFSKKIKMALETRDTLVIKSIFNHALKAGLQKQVFEAQKEFNHMLQCEHNRKLAQQLIKERRVDELRLVILNAKELEIADEAIFTEAEQVLIDSNDEAHAQRRLKHVIDSASRKGNIPMIQGAIDVFLNEYPDLASCEAVEMAKESMNNIERREILRPQILEAALGKDAGKIERLIFKAGDDPYLEQEINKARDRIQILRQGEQEVKRMQDIRNYKKLLRDELNKFKKKAETSDINILKNLVQDCRRYPELENQIKASESLIANLETKKLELALLHQKLTRINSQASLHSEEDSQSLATICFSEAESCAENYFLTGEDAFHSDKHSILEVSLELERQIRSAMNNDDIPTVRKLLVEVQNYPELEEVLVDAVDVIEKYENVQLLGSKLQEIIEFGDREQISDFLSLYKDQLNESSIKEARLAWKKLWEDEQKVQEIKSVLKKFINYPSAMNKEDVEKSIDRSEPYIGKDKELEGLIEQCKKEIHGTLELSVGKPHHLILLLHQAIQRLRNWFKRPELEMNSDGIHEGDIVTREPLKHEKLTVSIYNSHGQQVIRIINLILSNHTKRFWFSERTTWDIFKGSTKSVIQNAVREFESFEAVKTLPSDNFSFTISLLFLQYLTDRGYFQYCLKELLADHEYLAECFSEKSIILNEDQLDQFLGIVSLLEQFNFQFGFENNESIKTASQLSADLLISEPISEVRDSLHQIVQFFFINKRGGQQDLKAIGDDSKNIEVAMLVRDKFSKALYKSFNHGLKKGLLSNTFVWNFLESVCESKQIYAKDIGGIGLPHAIYTVNEVINQAQTGKSLSYQQVCEAKFTSFICHSLNEGQLSNFISSCFNSEEIDTFYENTALIHRASVQSTLLSLLKKLDMLPFRLDIVPF